MKHKFDVMFPSTYLLNPNVHDVLQAESDFIYTYIRTYENLNLLYVRMPQTNVSSHMHTHTYACILNDIHCNHSTEQIRTCACIT